MRFSYNLLKKIQPKLPVIDKVAEGLNSHVFEVDGIDGDVLDIDLLSNRWSDAASHIGMARECSAIFELPLESPVKRLVNISEGKGLVGVKVKEKNLCNRYAARVFSLPENVKRQKETEAILEDCGVQSINPVVDVMNYVMLETGQPLHAFDADKIEGGLVVRATKRGGEKITTLDGETYDLPKGALVIADKAGPLAIAGIKGGSRAAVAADTRQIIVEGAHFDMVAIARASRALKLRTDASARFEHDISPALVAWGLDRATELLVDMGAELTDSLDWYPRPRKERVVSWNVENHQNLIGVSPSSATAKKHLEALGLGVEKESEEKLQVQVPAWRTDIEREEDVIEEVARLEGYEDLEAVPPTDTFRVVEEDIETRGEELIRGVLISMGFTELYTSSFISEEKWGAEKKRNSFLLSRKHEPVPMENPISQDAVYFRTSLVPAFARALEDNSRFFEEFHIFELGSVAWREKSVVEEARRLGIGIATKGYPAVRELKGALEELLHDTGIVEHSTREKDDRLLVEIGHSVVGELFVRQPKSGWFLAMAELDVGKLLEQAEGEKEYREIPKYPAVMRDISLILDDVVRVGDVLEVIQSAAPDLVDDVDLIDEYTDETYTDRRSSRSDRQGKDIRQSITLRIVFQLPDRTLTSEEVDEAMERIKGALRERGDVSIR